MEIGYCLSIDELYRTEGLEMDFVDLSGQEISIISENEFNLVCRLLKRRGLKCRGIHSTFPPEIKLAGAQSKDKDVLTYFENLAVRCRSLEVQYIGIGSPSSRSLMIEDKKEEADRRLSEYIKKFCDIAPFADILLENLNPGECNYLNTVEDVGRVISMTDRDNAGILLDLYHFYLTEKTLAGISQTEKKKIRYLHFAEPEDRSYPGRYAASKIKELFLEAIQEFGACPAAVEAVTDNVRADLQKSRNTLAEWESEYAKRISEEKENTGGNCSGKTCGMES